MGTVLKQVCFESAGIGRVDLVLYATESQALNGMTAQLAMELGASKGLASTLNDRYLAVGSKLDVDALASVKAVVSTAVLETAGCVNIKTIHYFYEDDVEHRARIVKPGRDTSWSLWHGF